MSVTSTLIAEIEHEAANTRKLLANVPDEHFTWKPHEKSMSVKALASHIAILSGWPGLIATTDYLDFADGSLQHPKVETTADLLVILDEGVKKAVEALHSVSDADLANHWILRSGDHIILELPKAVMIRNLAMNHIYHHRGQLTVYLRMLNVPVPGMYGPSADEMGK